MGGGILVYMRPVGICGQNVRRKNISKCVDTLKYITVCCKHCISSLIHLCYLGTSTPVLKIYTFNVLYALCVYEVPKLTVTMSPVMVV